VIISHAEAPPAGEQREPSRALDVALRVAGVVISIVAAICTALLELFASPLRLAGFPIGVSIIFALVANPAIAWFAVTATGRRWALAPPWIIWTVIMLFATGYRTPEGDYLVMGDDWVALLTVLLGSLAWALYAYRMILGGRPPR